MSGAVVPSAWAVEQFGESARVVMCRVVTGLKRGQQAARSVQTAAVSVGAEDKRAYGSVWATRHHLLVEELADLPGYQVRRPRGASYDLAVINDRVLIPFRHDTSTTVPISRARVTGIVPYRFSRKQGVERSLSLFDIGDKTTGTHDLTAADVVEAAAAENLTVIYVAYVSNADSDDIQAAWWGTADTLEDDGHLVWSPEPLDVSIVDVEGSARPSVGSGDAVPATVTPGFADGEIPPLAVTRRPTADQYPISEAPPPAADEAENGNG